METPAILGGSPVISNYTFLSSNDFLLEEEDRAAAVAEIAGGNYFGRPGAPQIAALQKEWAHYCGTEHAVVLNSGTAALHGAVAAAGIGPGDEVIVPAFTFLTTATSVMYQNGIPVFCDIDPQTYTMSPESVERLISSRTRALIPVHVLGLPADMDAICSIARKHNLIVIEDACQAHGAEYNGKKTGNLGDMAAFSLQRSKNLSTGCDGGLFTTNSLEFCERAEMVGRFGEVLRPDEARRYNAAHLGWMYRSDEILAAIARKRLKRLDADTEKRRALAHRLTARLSKLPGVITPVEPEGRKHVYHIYVLRFDPAAAGYPDMPLAAFRSIIEEALAAEGAPVCRWQLTPLYKQTLFMEKAGYGKGCPWSCPHARSIEYSDEICPETVKFMDSYVGIMNAVPGETEHGMNLICDCFEKIWENLSTIMDSSMSLMHH
ncbi:MAG: DegT/DnrJ/EryC1/StrS family aminotransferase [bacterium]|nr:DegT/DnrJ/EryC1/StrS family aminotransferase [bacterium]